MRHLAKFILILGIPYFFYSCSDKTEKADVSNGEAMQVDAYVVRADFFSNELVTTANLLPNEQVNIMAPISSQVLGVYFNEGRYVTKGEVLIRMDDRSWKAQLLAVQAELKVAKNDYQRKKSLLSVGGSSEEEVENAFSKMEVLQSQEQQLQVNIQLANVSAPFSGQLGMRNFSEGAFLKQGELITTISAYDKLKVDFTLPQVYANSIKVDQSVYVLINKDTLQAKIYAVNAVIDAQTRTINIRALLPQNGKKRIYPGTFAEVLIQTDQIKDALLIPTQAVVPSINEQTVYVYQNGKAVRKTVSLGDRTADKVHIVSGIMDGDTIITTGLLGVKDGMNVNIQTIK